MPSVLFLGGGLNSVTAGASIDEITTFMDNTYAPSCLHIANAQAGYVIYTCVDAAGAPTTVVGGQTFFGHFSYNFTNPFNTGQNLCYIRDSAGNPWLSIRSNGGSPTFGLYYNSGTAGAPVWTQLGGNFAMPQNTGPYQRLDFAIQIGNAGNHIVSLYNKEALVVTNAAFTQALFTNIRDMQIQPGTGDCMVWEVIMTEGISTVGCHVGYSSPNAAGSNAGWTGANTDVGEAVNSDATVNTSTVAGQKTTYNTTDVAVPATNTIRTVWWWLRGKNDGSNPSNIKSVVRSGGVDTVAAANAPGIGIAFGALRAAEYATDPNTGLAWTQAGFNAAEFGYQSAA